MIAAQYQRVNSELLESQLIRQEYMADYKRAVSDALSSVFTVTL